MAKKRRLIPFDFMPASWGLNGKVYEKAKAEYYFEGNELEEQLAMIDADSDIDKEVIKLGIKLKNEEINEFEHDKQVSTLKNEPWVNVIRMGIDEENVVQGYFELDWNDEFVAMLQSKGITGTSDEDVVNKWFNAVCRTVLLNEQADRDYGMQPGDRDDVVITRDEPEGEE